MDVTEALQSRYTCREFRPDPISKQAILEILEAAKRAPSWADTQPWELFVAGGEVLERIRKSYLERFAKGAAPQPDLPAPTRWPEHLKQRMDELLELHKKEAQATAGHTLDSQVYLERQMRFFNAPVVAYLCMEKNLTPWSVFDLGIFTHGFMLAAKERGLDTAPAYRLVAYPDLIRQEMGIPPELSLVFGVALGHGKPKHDQHGYDSPRRNTQDLARFKGF